MAAAKEVTFLDYADIEDRLPEYELHFSDVHGQTAVGEFTTRYFASERPAPRIRELIPRARLIICLRNPADQIYSHYWHLARQNFHQPGAVKHLSFEQALERHADMLKRPAMYSQHLEYWLRYFDREQFLVLLYEDIKHRPQAVLQQAFRFLGVDADYYVSFASAESGTARKGVSPRNALAQSIHAGLYAILNKRIYQPIKRRVGVYRANQLKEILGVRRIMERIFFQEGYPEMRADTRRLLTKEFGEQVRGLEDFLGKPLNSWK
jgi:hypothetical protein